MDLHRDFSELFALLNGKSVEYLVVGGYAVAFHGAPRFTGDLDVFVRPTASNVSRMLEVVSAFGFPSEGLDVGELLRSRKILQLGHPPLQIHLMTSITDVSWEAAWESRCAADYAGVPVTVIGRDALIRNKRATGRAKDAADADALAASGGESA